MSASDISVVCVQFEAHPGPRAMLLSTLDPAGDRPLVEGAPNDFFWGRGVDGSGSNHLGALLMRLRASFQDQQPLSEAPALLQMSQTAGPQQA